jgi:hypothetical protein|tara:strand:+ start:115 stop:300 length:186 start_codon:yes stop_codon:yes gene_type:complete
MKKVIKSNKSGECCIIEDESDFTAALINCLDDSEGFEVRDFSPDDDGKNIYDIYVKQVAER